MTDEARKRLLADLEAIQRYTLSGGNDPADVRNAVYELCDLVREILNYMPTDEPPTHWTDRRPAE